MSQACELAELSPQPAVAIRATAAVADLPRVLSEGYRAIAEYLAEAGEPIAGPPFAVYYNEDMQALQIEFGFPVSRPIEGKGEMQPAEAPSGRAATSMHVGPYADCEPAYRALAEWVKQNGHQPTGVAFEMYLNDPNEVPPEEIQTRIGLLLKK